MSYIAINLEETPRYENAPVIAPYRVSTVTHYLPIQTAQLTSGRNDIDRADELRNIEGAVPRLVDFFEPGGSLTYRGYLNTLLILFVLNGWQYAYTAGAGTNATLGPNLTTVTGVNALNSATVNVGSTAGFPTAGTFLIGAATLVTYTGKTDTSFTGCGAHPATVGGETAKDVLPVGANKWVLTKKVGPVPYTAQFRLVYNEHSIYLQSQGVGVSNLSFNAEGAVSAELTGLTYQRLTSDPALTPVLDTAAIRPALRGDLFLSWLANSATTDDFSFAISNPLTRRRTLSLTTPSKFADVLEMGDERVALTGSIPKSKLASADIDALMSGATFASRAIWTLPTLIGASTFPYMLDINMPACQYISGDAAELANRRRFGHDFDFFAAWDETAGYDAKITIVNAVSTIAAPFGT